MKSCSVKSYGKLNLTLNIDGINKDGFHNLDTIVTTVNKFNKITVTKRKDKKILVTYKGRYGFIPKEQAKTNAYKTCYEFINKYDVNGVNIVIDVNIPNGSGMGGSSADISGTLKALQKLYNIEDNMEEIANKFGSDSKYLLKGGFKRLKGKGDQIEDINFSGKLYFLVIYAESGVNTVDCFKEFDSKNYNGNIAKTDKFIENLEKGDILGLKGLNGNALRESAITLNEEIKENLEDLLSLSPIYADMTGSGSTCFALFDSYEMASWGLWKLKRKHYGNIEVLESYDFNELPAFLKLKSVFSPITDKELKE